MITIGKINKLKISQIKGKKCFIDGGEEYGEIFVRARDLPKGTLAGNIIDVFIYSSNDGIHATVKKPLAQLGEFAFMEVVSVSEFGAFLDWGIDKDLFLPKRYFKTGSTSTWRGKGKTDDLPSVGEKLLVRVIEDPSSKGVIATTEISNYIENVAEGLEQNEEADMLVYKFTNLGANVIINNRYRGVIYQNEIFSPLEKGDRFTGYIKKLRDDGRIDASLVKQGFTEANAVAEKKVIKTLELKGGYLALNDKSSPDEIKEILHISKKSFKRATGTLYKKKKIIIEEKGIRLAEEDQT